MTSQIRSPSRRCFRLQSKDGPSYACLGTVSAARFALCDQAVTRDNVLKQGDFDRQCKGQFALSALDGGLELCHIQKLWRSFGIHAADQLQLLHATQRMNRSSLDQKKQGQFRIEIFI